MNFDYHDTYRQFLGGDMMGPDIFHFPGKGPYVMSSLERARRGAEENPDVAKLHLTVPRQCGDPQAAGKAKNTFSQPAANLPPNYTS